MITSLVPASLSYAASLENCLSGVKFLLDLTEETDAAVLGLGAAQNRRAKLADRIRMSRSSAVVAFRCVAVRAITHGEIARIGQTTDGDVVAMTGLPRRSSAQPRDALGGYWPERTRKLRAGQDVTNQMPVDLQVLFRHPARRKAFFETLPDGVPR